VTIVVKTVGADGCVQEYELTAGQLPQGLWPESAVYRFSRVTAA
jgi:hypothetical protein